MDINECISPFLQLGKRLRSMRPDAWRRLLDSVGVQNPWFTDEQITLGFSGLNRYLEEEKLTRWLHGYPARMSSPKTVGLIMAGNIPLVGFHDLLCVLLSGHNAMIKLSRDDSILIPFIIENLVDIDDRFRKRMAIAEHLKDYDAIIATGSDNSARYFEYYFAKAPHIIRRNRTSVAILRGDETPSDLRCLADDVFQYFGLGCRNVAKAFAPEDFDAGLLLDSFEPFRHYLDHHKYANNYYYRRSVYAVNRVHHLDSGFYLLVETPELFSPISVLYIETYKSIEALEGMIGERRAKIQCIVSKDAWYPDSARFGKSQQPELWNYADDVDTMQFLLGL